MTFSLLNGAQFDIKRNFISDTAATSLDGFALSTFALFDDPPPLFLFIRSRFNFMIPSLLLDARG